MDNENQLSIPPKSALRENVIAQVLGLFALALIVLAISGQYKFLLYAAGFSAVAVSVMKPSLIPYLFILTFFTMKNLFMSGRTLCVHVTDAAFLLLLFAFISNKKLSIMAALEKQRFLLISLSLFALWTVVGFIANFYGRTGFENVTSLYFMFNFVTLALAVLLFSQPQWKEVRDKIIFFYVICAFCEIVLAISLEIFDGARSFSDFHKFTGTLGPHHAMLGNVMALSFGVAMCAYFELREKSAKLFSLCVAVMSLGTILLSGTRSAMLGMLLAVPVVLFLGIFRKWGTALLALLPIAVVAVLFRGQLAGLVVSTMLGSLNTDSAVDMSAYGRILIWERVYEHAVSGPIVQKIVGIGVGAFTTLRFNYFLEVGTFTTGAHNNFLHVFVEAGIIGLIIFLAFFTGIIKRLVVRLRRKDYAAGCFLLCTFILLFSGLMQETFWFDPSFGRFFLQYLVFYLLIFNFRKEPEGVTIKSYKACADRQS